MKKYSDKEMLEYLAQDEVEEAEKFTLKKL